jgi:Uma2 family endonuclease
MGIALNRHHFTVDDFNFLHDQGKFKPEDRLELIEGEIFEMSPIGSFHARCVDFLSNTLVVLLFSKYIVRIQSPVILNDLNQPRPDIAVIRYQQDFYKHSHPKAADVLLIIEVSDTTVELDRNIKFPKYAAARVPEAWLVDLPAQRIEVHSGLQDKTYGMVKVYQRGEEVVSATMPGVKFSVDDILG